MNPSGLMQFMSGINSFKNNHPKFASFLGILAQSGMPEGTVIEMTVTKPGEDPITANMQVLPSDIEFFKTLKDMKP